MAYNEETGYLIRIVTNENDSGLVEMFLDDLVATFWVKDLTNPESACNAVEVRKLDDIKYSEHDLDYQDVVLIMEDLNEEYKFEGLEFYSLKGGSTWIIRF